MKFVLFCDVLRAPGDQTKPVVGARFSGAAVRKSPGETDTAFDNALKDLFKDVAGQLLPKPGEGDFDTYLKNLATGAGPLFPWIGGELEFSFLWASAERGKIPSKIDPSGVTAVPIAIPRVADATKKANFELSDTSFRFLLYTALSDLISDKRGRTNRFTKREPFRLVGWDDTLGRQRIDEIDDQAVPNFRYEAFMAGLASLPAPIPHGRLNLVRFVQLTAINPPSTGTEFPFLVAAPRFKPLGAAAFLEPKFGTTVDPASWNVLKPNLIATVPYNAPFGGYDVEVVCRALDLEEDLTSSGSFLQRDSLWVARRHDTASLDSRDGVGFEDWLARLPELIADTFDLPRLLLQAMEEDSKVSTAPPLTGALAAGGRLAGAGRMAEAALMALRDIVGPGCVGVKPAEALKGSNGSPAHLAIIDRVNEAIRPTVKLAPADCAALGADVTRYDNDFRAAFRVGSGDAQRLEWLDILAKALGPGLDLPATGAAFLDEVARRVAVDATALGAFDPAPLRRVIDAATLPVNAAALQVALWRKASPGCENWLSAADEAFAVLLEHGLRLVEILRKANIDLPWLADAGIWKKAADPTIRDVDVLIGSASAPGNIRDAITAYLFGTACESDGAPSPLEQIYQDTHGRMGRLPGAARGAAAKAVDAAAKARLTDWFTPPETEGTDTLLSGGLAADAHPVAVQIDRLIVGAGDAPDFNENLAGFGMLMRRLKPVDAWRCLTATFAEIDPDEVYDARTDVTFETAARSVMGALPVSYTSAMPQAIVMYDNRPIVGDTVAEVAIDPQPGEEPDPRIVRLIQPVIQDNPPAETLLPFLAYGATYEVAPFGISNQGALPEMIRRDDYPAILDPAKLIDTLFPGTSAFVRRFSYLRRTGIGSLGVAPFFAPAQQAGRVFHPMVAPKDTRPLAEEILAPPQAVEPWGKAGAPRPLKMKTALLLADADGNALVAKPENIDCGELKLRIGAPLTSLDDFDRWIAFDEATLSGAAKDELRAFRKGLRAFHFDQTSALHELEVALREAIARNDNTAVASLQAEIDAIKPTLDLQDPAVGALGVSVSRVRRDGALAPDAVASHKPELFEWTWKWALGMDPQAPFAASRLPAELVCRLSRDRTKPLFDKATKTVWVAPGDVLIVRLFAGVDDDLFVDKVAPDGKRRFDKVVGDNSIGDGDASAVVAGPGGTRYRLFSMHAFALEAASFGLPSDVELGATIGGSIVGDVPDASDERSGDIRLDFKRASSIAMDAIGTITVGSQAWRWTGRPLSPFPFAKAANLNVFPPQDPQDPGTSEPPSLSEHALLWDVEGFAERLDETLDDELAAAPITEMIDPVAVPPASKPRAMRIGLRSPGRADTARYMRFRIVAWSRYAAAYAAAYEPVAPRGANWKSASGKWATPWYRMLRPARKPESVPKPGIRALIPLTRALRKDEQASPVSGVLAVADGAWFEHAGLADWMLAGTENAYRKKLVVGGSTIVAAAAEMGPDPLVRAYGLGQEEKKTPDHTKLRTAVPLEVAGPLGHGFDTGTATGLYLNSSFVVRAPELTENDSTAWWMGKLAFRRFVMAEGTRDYWNETVATPFTSVEPQISATLHSVSASAAPSSIKFRAAGELITGTTTKAQAAVVVQASRTDSAWKVEVEDTASGAKDSFAVAEATFDLRIIAVRRISRVPEGPEQYVWYEILVLVKPKNRAWEVASQTQWFNDPKFAENKEPAETKLKIDFPIDAQTGVVVGDKRVSTVLQVSEATEGRWAQFMPNSEALGRSSRVLLTDLKLSVDPKSSTQLLLSSKGGQFAWLATDTLKTARGKENQGLFNLLLVTKRVASVSGTDEEAYVGLYHSSLGYDAVAEAVVLSWFDRGTPRPLNDGSELIGRVLTVRTGNPTVTAAQIADWQKDPWKFFFPPEKSQERTEPTEVFGENRPPDASAQIIEMYAPISAETNA